MTQTQTATCSLCGDPLPPGEDRSLFKFVGLDASICANCAREQISMEFEEEEQE